MKILDFEVDSDQEPDLNGEYTSATLKAGTLPESFTICLGFTVQAWNSVYAGAKIFQLLDAYAHGKSWGFLMLYAGISYTEYIVSLGPSIFSRQKNASFFPLQWTRACLSLNLVAGKVTLVVDGQLLGESKDQEMGPVV